jgi:hypothetical protein
LAKNLTLDSRQFHDFQELSKMSLVYDYKSGMFVVNPKFVELDPEVVALSVEHIFRKYLAIPVLEDGRRLLILVIERIRRIDLDDIELVTGFKRSEHDSIFTEASFLAARYRQPTARRRQALAQRRLRRKHTGPEKTSESSLRG